MKKRIKYLENLSRNEEMGGRDRYCLRLPSVSTHIYLQTCTDIYIHRLASSLFYGDQKMQCLWVFCFFILYSILQHVMINLAAMKVLLSIFLEMCSALCVMIISRETWPRTNIKLMTPLGFNVRLLQVWSLAAHNQIATSMRHWLSKRRKNNTSE